MMEEGCIFCKIIAGKIPGDILHSDDRVVAFRDISPQAPTHVLVMPRQHIPAVTDVGEQQGELMGHLFQVANDLARKEGIAERGFRLAVNCGEEGGQYVPHLHFHLIGGRRLSDELG